MQPQTDTLASLDQGKELESNVLNTLDVDKALKCTVSWLRHKCTIQYFEEHPAARNLIVTAVQKATHPIPLFTPAASSCDANTPSEQASASLPSQHSALDIWPRAEHNSDLSDPVACACQCHSNITSYHSPKRGQNFGERKDFKRTNLDRANTIVNELERRSVNFKTLEVQPSIYHNERYREQSDISEASPNQAPSLKTDVTRITVNNSTSEHHKLEKPPTPSSDVLGLDSSPTSPRSRYNSNFVSKLLKFHESNPEADLAPRISKYNTERLNQLRGASTFLPVPDTKREPKVLQPVIPKPYGDFSIFSPLELQVKALICPNVLDKSNSFSGPVAALWRLLQSGKVLYQIHSTWVIKITDSIVVKFAPGLDMSEYHTMSYVWSYRENIPMPQPLGAVSVGSFNYIFMSYIEGHSLAELWPSLSPELKRSVQSQLGKILQCLRQMPLQSKYLGSGDPPICRDSRQYIRASAGCISTEMEFKAFLVSTAQKLNPVYLDLITSTLGTSHQIVMTHSDLRPENILVSLSAANTIKITGLVDWELSGAYPEYWEYVKALTGVKWSLSDWYSYLPIDILGKHDNAWRQDLLIDRLVF